MTFKNKILVIGEYTPEQLGKLESEFDPVLLKNADSIPEVSLAIRETIAGVAFKGHRPLEFDETKFDLLPELKIISNFGVGYDAIDISEATARGVKVTNTPDVLNDDVADVAVGMLIALSREFSMGVNWVKSGDWGKFGEMPLNRKVSGKKAGILGLGRIGGAIADRLSAFKMDIHYYARSKKSAPKSWTYHADPVALASEVDFLFVALVGGEETSKLASAEVIRALGPDGILINISRGSTVDEDALLEALKTKRIRGAALDVFAGEPNINPKFLELENVFMQPHQGSGTVETREAMSKLQRDNLANFFGKKALLTPVN
jgi:lactate dehydrogenase-like 2-hydroxyacid dehydrogenase